jgi:hypothetical protein
MNYRELCCNSGHGWPRTRTDAATEPNRGHPVHRKLIPAHATLLASPAARGINSGQALKLKQVTSLLPSPTSLLAGRNITSSTSTMGMCRHPATTAATATSPSMSRNRTILLRLRLARADGVLAKQSHAVDGAATASSSSDGAR